MRALRRSWKGRRENGKVISVRHTFTLRSRWYDEGDGVNIRLCLEDEEGLHNHYPSTEQEGEAMWQAFKSGGINARGE